MALAKQIADYNANQASLGPEPQPFTLADAMVPEKPPMIEQAPPRVTGPDPQQQLINNDQAQLQKVRWNQEHPWGTAENHPGTMGKIAHVLSVAANIGGDIVAPGTMSLIPGTQLNMQDKESGLAHRLNAEIGDQSQNQFRGAEQAKDQEATAEMPQKAADEHSLSGAQARHFNAEADAAQQPSLAAAYAHAVGVAMKDNRDPQQDPIVQHLADAITSIQKQPAPKDDQTKTADLLGPDGKQHIMGWDAKTSKYDVDMGLKGEKPPVVKLETPGEQRSAKNDVLKAYQPTLDSAERFNVMAENYERAIKGHDQQAMLSLLANHLGMTMGLQKGARLTKDIIHEAQQSQPWLAGIAAKFDPNTGYLSGVTLSPGQMRQMVQLGQSRYSEDAKKSRATAQYLGAHDDGPARQANDAAMRYYLGLTNNDATKARELMTKDGWTL